LVLNSNAADHVRKKQYSMYRWSLAYGDSRFFDFTLCSSVCNPIVSQEASVAKVSVFKWRSWKVTPADKGRLLQQIL
jgi:hypothetical protein